MKTNAVLVTGGLGFIGSHTVVELLNEGFPVVVIDDLSNSSTEVLNGVEKICGKQPVFFKVNVLNQTALESIIKDHQIDTIIHFAAFKAVGESVGEPLKYYRNNIGGMISLLGAMENTGVRKLVFSSSCTVYGQPDHLPVTEDSPVVKAESPYGNTKKMGEDILRDVCQTGKIQVVSLRYFNPVGAHSSGLIGELPVGVPNNLVPYITQTAAGWRKQLTVFGNDYQTVDGSCVRDFIHVTDLAFAHLQAMKHLEHSREPFDVYNIGTGVGISVLELIAAFEKATGLKLNYTIGPRRPGDVEQIWADCKKANTVLGWKATRHADEMMLDAWRWQQTLQVPEG